MGCDSPSPGGGQSHNPVPGWAWLPGPGSEERMMRLRQLGCARGTPSPCTRACMTHAHGHPSQDLQRGHRVQRADHSQGCSVPELPGREVPGHRGLLHPAHLLPGGVGHAAGTRRPGPALTDGWGRAGGFCPPCPAAWGKQCARRCPWSEPDSCTFSAEHSPLAAWTFLQCVPHR